MMKSWKILEAEWEHAYEALSRTEYFELMAEGRLELAHYKGFLRESYHNVRQNPKNMALFVSQLDTDRAPLAAKFLKHTAMEMGHDELALADLQSLGEDSELVRRSLPLPTTEALGAFIYFQLMQRNPLAYLGYSFHLETLPIRMGVAGISLLEKMGVPATATTFLQEHAEADPVHMRWNREYVEGFVRSRNDLDAVVFGLRGACELHGVMFQGILDASRRKSHSTSTASTDWTS